MVQVFIFGVSHVQAIDDDEGDYAELYYGDAVSKTMKKSVYNKTAYSKVLEVQNGGNYFEEWLEWIKKYPMPKEFDAVINEKNFVYFGADECKIFYKAMKSKWADISIKYGIKKKKITFYYNLMMAFKLGSEDGFVGIIS